MTTQIPRALNRDVTRELKRQIWSTTLHHATLCVEYTVTTAVVVTW